MTRRRRATTAEETTYDFDADMNEAFENDRKATILYADCQGGF